MIYFHSVRYVMRKDLGAKPCMYPEPVLIIGTYNEDGTPNAMNAAWGGIHQDNEIYICVDKGHKTAENLRKRKAFTVSFANEDNIKACDYVGIVSGNDVSDKFARAGFTSTRSANVDAPMINELPLTIECRVLSYEDEELIGEIVNISADESILTDGKIDVGKLRPIAYDGFNHVYLRIGGEVGRAFSIGNALK